ncbi:MAG: mechanosensitive ion channel family protein [Candidatus Methylumidiphilus sp.]
MTNRSINVHPMMTNTNRPFSIPKPCLAVGILVLWACQLMADPASATEANPLRPIDTSSPRATLQGFLETTNKSYTEKTSLLNTYLTSQRLFLAPEEVATMQDSLSHIESVERTLDLSELPPATFRESSRRLVLQLKEILDRVELPPLESIPDEEAMSKLEFKRWTIPGTAIRIARIEKGPRTGEYLFTAETMERVPEFYLKVKNLPYKPGASVGWYDTASNSPSGVAIALHNIIPPRWVLTAGESFRAMFLGQPLWRWFGVVAVLGAGLAVILLCYRLCRHWSKRGKSAKRWARLLKPLSVVMVTPAVVLILAEVLRITGIVYQAFTFSLWTVFYLALTWLVWMAGSAVAETVIAHERLRESSIDSQLVRLALRLVTIVLAIAILIAGADRIGLPAYSVLAGLGVGGLAVALAAQQTLANLLGSIIIMIEKPFAIGHWIKVKDMEGIVEDVGFRSTRIRTFYDSLVTIPSSQMVSSTIDNMELRKLRQVKTFLNLTYDTPVEKIEGFVEGVRHILQNHPDTRKDNIQVMFNDLGPSSLDILLNFFLKVPDRMAELTERQRILLDILRLAESMGVRFAT